MRAVFKDSMLQQAIEERGYVTIPFLSEKEVDLLRSIYENNKSDRDSSEFHLSIWTSDVERKKVIHDEIVGVIKQKCIDLFDNYKHVVSNLAVKHPGQKSDFDLHQGINFVEEERFTSITLWIPLQDVNEENGCMQVIPRSHTFFNQPVRSQHYPTPFENIKEHIKKNHLVNLEMKSGEAWIFNHRLLHCSPVNQSNHVRLATLNVMVPSEASVILYYKASNEVQSESVEILEFMESNYHLQNVYAKPEVSGLISRGFTKEIHYQLSAVEFDAIVEPSIGSTNDY